MRLAVPGVVVASFCGVRTVRWGVEVPAPGSAVGPWAQLAGFGEFVEDLSCSDDAEAGEVCGFGG